MKELPFQTLHCHTIASDGLLTHEEVLDECLKNKIGLVAFTDHDSLPSPEKIESLKKLNHSVKFVTGVEISCDGVREVQDDLSLHVTGLFTDPTNAALLNFSRKQLKSRQKRMEQTVKNLASLGFNLTEADVLKEVTGSAVGSPHIVAALSRKEENCQLLNKFLNELEELALTDPLRKKQLDEIRTREEKNKWYILVMSKDALHSVHVAYHAEDLVLLDEAVRLIRGACGIALLAHWSYARAKLTLPLVDKILSEGRLNGMETIYAFGNEFNKDLFWEDMQDLSRLCQNYGLVEGGGGDFHKSEDFRLMINPRFSYLANKTKDLIGNILKRHPNLDRRWSTL